MKQILVATDFSNCASNAMEYAVELAKILKIEVCAIHAIHSTEGVDNSIYHAIFIEDYYASKREALANWAKSFVEKEGYSEIKVTTICDVGSVSSVLTKYIESNHVEILVMGSMGATGISGLFGSNVSMMVEKTKTPTLVIPLETKFSENPTITLAVDFSANLSTDDVTALNELILAFNSDKINVLNIIDTPSPEWKTNEAGENTLKNLVKNTALDFKYIHEANPIEGIMNFIASSNTDILCLVKRHHHMVYRLFNRSTVTKVMNKSVKAILVLHE